MLFRSSKVKADIDSAENGYISPIEHYLYVCQEDIEVVKMYPDVYEAKGVTICVYQSAEDATCD